MSSSVVQDDRIDQDQEPEPDEPQAVGLTSIYPAVPNLYKRFTKANLNKLQILQSYQLKEDEPPWEELTPELRIKRQNQILSEASQQQDEQQQDADAATTDKEATQPLDFDLLSSLAPPRADWILEDGFFYSFGDRWPLPDIFPTLEETGIQQLYPKDLPIDRRKILSNLLKTLLSTHLELTTLLLSPPNYYQVTQLVPVGPPIQSQDGSWKEQLGEVEMVRTEAMDKWEHIRTVVINFQYLVNECRPMQVSLVERRGLGMGLTLGGCLTSGDLS